jgi:hypothetical protein
MVFLDDEAQVKARFYSFGNSANLDVDGWTVCTECTRWNSYAMWVMSNLVLAHLETVLVSCKIGPQFVPNVEIILHTPVGSLR